jgi:hypothetical protein
MSLTRFELDSVKQVFEAELAKVILGENHKELDEDYIDSRVFELQRHLEINGVKIDDS